MSLKVTFGPILNGAQTERALIHAWATERPFTFGLLCAVAAYFGHLVLGPALFLFLLVLLILLVWFIGHLTTDPQD